MSYVPYTTKAGDRWDLIAYRMYGDASRYAPIIDANRPLFATAPLSLIPTVLDAGLELKIPVLDAPFSPDDVPPWRR